MTLLLLVAGFVIWSSAFVLLYAASSIGCAAGWERTTVAGTSLLRALLVLLWIAHLGALVALVIYTWRRRPGGPGGTATFVRRVAVGAGTAALVATLWTGAPIVATTMCDQYDAGLGARTAAQETSAEQASGILRQPSRPAIAPRDNPRSA
ncbi:hypothetical protein [Rhodoplanes elegans]|uniref:hypothetical protein n=1 Tax=Rhodoplanes elegans TaxID=29408 RepID=UPI001914322D|nr:hypothetical protein [Rhodoplanes elegans]